MNPHLLAYLTTYTKATLDLAELERVVQALCAADADEPTFTPTETPTPTGTSEPTPTETAPLHYATFAAMVLELEAHGVLEPVKASGRNGKPLSLAYRYRVQKRLLGGGHTRELHQWSARLHPALSLDAYYRLGPERWLEDRPYIEQVDAYLKRQALPSRHAPAPERSYELVRDEKWMTEQGGQALLERIGIWDKLLVVPVQDPLMLAVNPTIPMDSKVHRHLIVENKTTFQGLLLGLSSMPFSTLIYGSGRKIVGNLSMLRYQYQVSPQSEQKLYYFGDMDLEGILIWYDLQARCEVRLAMPFYRACLERKPSPGKTNHRYNQQALEAFASCFEAQEAERITTMLRTGCYIPQETLTSDDLQRLGRDRDAWA